MKELFNITIILDQFYSVKGKNRDVNMILFHGETHGKYFNGEVLPGGVDTQKGDRIHDTALSARYILKGKDDQQKDCQIFIENNGICQKDGKIVTTPQITTDSESLQWLEDAKLSGTVEPEKECIHILIYGEEL